MSCASEVDRAAVRARTLEPRRCVFESSLHHSQALWFRASAHLCFLRDTGNVIEFDSSWFLQGLKELLWNRTPQWSDTMNTWQIGARIMFSLPIVRRLLGCSVGEGVNLVPMEVM